VAYIIAFIIVILFFGLVGDMGETERFIFRLVFIWGPIFGLILYLLKVF